MFQKRDLIYLSCLIPFVGSTTCSHALEVFKKPDFELYSALSYRGTDNALQTPGKHKFDTFIVPVTGLIATGELWQGASYRLAAFYSSELYKQQPDAGFNRFSAGFTITQKYEGWNIALQTGRRRTYDQPFKILNSDAWTFGISLSRAFDFGVDLVITPTIGATRRINVPVLGSALISTNILDKTEAGQNALIYRGALEMVKTWGDWSVTLTPDIARTINNPLATGRTTETLISLDAIIGYKFTKNVTGSVNLTAIKAFSNDINSTYHSFSGGPGASLTFKF